MLLPGHEELNQGAGNSGVVAYNMHSSDDSKNDKD
jgi:hypothetical protein